MSSLRDGSTPDSCAIDRDIGSHFTDAAGQNVEIVVPVELQAAEIIDARHINRHRTFRRHRRRLERKRMFVLECPHRIGQTILIGQTPASPTDPACASVVRGGP